MTIRSERYSLARVTTRRYISVDISQTDKFRFSDKSVYVASGTKKGFLIYDNGRSFRPKRFIDKNYDSASPKGLEYGVEKYTKVELN